MNVALASFVILFAGNTNAVPSKTVTHSSFEQFELGKTKKAQVVKTLGQGTWDYEYWTRKGDTPVQLHYGNQGNYPGADRIKGMEALDVIVYDSGDASEPFLAVFRNDKLDYWIGPTGKDERSAKAIKSRYGDAQMWIDESRVGHLFLAVDVVSYEKAGVCFLRQSSSKGGGDFTAKLVARKVPNRRTPGAAKTPQKSRP